MSVRITTLAACAPLAAEELEESLPAAPGGRLRVELATGTIEVEGHDEPRVDVSARSSGWPRIQFELEQRGDTVWLRGEPAGRLRLGLARVHVHVRVPVRFDADLRTRGGRIAVRDLDGGIDARTSGGDVEVEEIEGEVALETSGGTIRAHEILGRLRAETSGGTIHASEVVGDVEAHTGGGAIRMDEVTGPVEARTSGGPVEVRFSAPPAGRLETSGGGIDVALERDHGLDLAAHTSGGRIAIDPGFEVHGRAERSDVDAQIGGGGERLELHTSGGNIRLRPR